MEMKSRTVKVKAKLDVQSAHRGVVEMGCLCGTKLPIGKSKNRNAIHCKVYWVTRTDINGLLLRSIVYPGTWFN